MNNIKIIKHCDMTDHDIEDIVRLKDISWPHTYNEHVEWLKGHMKSDDIHIILYSNRNYNAYLNLINITITIDGIPYKALGVGNVCAAEKGKGYGSRLMESVNEYLRINNKIGLLFCKRDLIKFYAKNNWDIVEKNNLVLSFNNVNIETMIYNSGKFNILSYDDEIF